MKKRHHSADKKSDDSQEAIEIKPTLKIKSFGAPVYSAQHLHKSSLGAKSQESFQSQQESTEIKIRPLGVHMYGGSTSRAEANSFLLD